MKTPTPTMHPTEIEKREWVFHSKAKAKVAADEVMHNGWPAGVSGSERNWRVKAHGYTEGRTHRINYILGVDGKLYEYNRIKL